MIKRIPTPDMQKWPVNSSVFLLPTVALKGVGPIKNVIFVWWKWRVDFEYQANVKDEVRP